MKRLIDLVDIGLSRHLLGDFENHGVAAHELVLAFRRLLQLLGHCVPVFVQCDDVDEVDPAEEHRGRVTLGEVG